MNPAPLSPLGRFMEISIHTADIQESLEFHEQLGFRQATVGDVWSHPYAVLTDGRLFMGLHQYEFDSPALTYVRAGLAGHLGALRSLGIEFAFCKTAEHEFNEAGFTDPDGQMVAILEARTFSPPTFEADSFSVCGHFSEFSMSVRELDSAIGLWESLGFVLTTRDEKPFPRAVLTSDGLNLGLYQTRSFAGPAITFCESDMPERREYIRNKGFALQENSCGIGVDHAVLVSPCGVQFLLCTNEP